MLCGTEYASNLYMLAGYMMRVSEMNITLKLLLLLYLLLIIAVTIFGFAWTLTAIFAPRWVTNRALFVSTQNKLNRMK